MARRVTLPRGKDGRFGEEVGDPGMKGLLAGGLLGLAVAYLFSKPKRVYLTVNETPLDGGLFARAGVKFNHP
jgi:hypothetical protein